jgi:hypothetical protein
MGKMSDKEVASTLFDECQRMKGEMADLKRQLTEARAEAAAATEREHIRCLKVFEKQVDAATGPTGGWIVSPKKLFSDIALNLLCVIDPAQSSALAQHDEVLETEYLVKLGAIEMLARGGKQLKDENDPGWSVAYLEVREILAQHAAIVEGFAKLGDIWHKAAGNRTDSECAVELTALCQQTSSANFSALARVKAEAKRDEAKVWANKIDLMYHEQWALHRLAALRAGQPAAPTPQKAALAALDQAVDNLERVVLDKPAEGER